MHADLLHAAQRVLVAPTTAEPKFFLRGTPYDSARLRQRWTYTRSPPRAIKLRRHFDVYTGTPWRETYISLDADASSGAADEHRDELFVGWATTVQSGRLQRSETLSVQAIIDTVHEQHNLSGHGWVSATLPRVRCFIVLCQTVKLFPGHRYMGAVGNFNYRSLGYNQATTDLLSRRLSPGLQYGSKHR